METPERFEDFDLWRDARELAGAVHRLRWRGAACLVGALRRTALRAMCRIAEGAERASSRRFARSLDRARAAVSQLRSLLYVAQDLGHLDEASARALQQRCLDLSHRLSAFIRHLGRPPEATGDW